MAITTPDQKLALLQWGTLFGPGMVLAETAGFATADRQQLLGGYPGIAWGDPVEDAPPQNLLALWHDAWRRRGTVSARKVITVSNDPAGYGLVEAWEDELYNAARIFCDTANVRYWTTKGDPPTASVGLILYAAQTLPLTSKGEIQHFRAIRQGGTDALLVVELFE